MLNDSELQLCTRLSLTEGEFESIKSLAKNYRIEYVRSSGSCFLFRNLEHNVPFTFVIDNEWSRRRRLRFHATYRPCFYSYTRPHEENGGGENFSITENDMEGTLRATLGGPGMD